MLTKTEKKCIRFEFTQFHIILITLFTLFFIKGLLFVFIIPPWQGPDETTHFKNTCFIHNTPSEKEFDAILLRSLNKHQYWKYIDYSQEKGSIPKFSDTKQTGYYAILSPIIGIFNGFEEKLFIARIFSVILFLSILFFIYIIAKELLTLTDRWLIIAILSFAGLHPQWSFFSIVLNSDNAINFLLAGIVLCLALIIKKLQKREKFQTADYAICFLFICFTVSGLFVKRTGVIGVCLAVLSLLFLMPYHIRIWRYLYIVFITLAVFFTVLSVVIWNYSKTRYDRGLRNFPNETTYSFPAISGSVKVYYEIYDIDYDTEVMIMLNGKKFGFAKVTKDNSWSGFRSILLPEEMVQNNSENCLTFKGTRVPASDWGVRNVKVANAFIGEPQGHLPFYAKGDESSLLYHFNKIIVSTKFYRGTVLRIYERMGKNFNLSQSTLLFVLRFFMIQFISFWFSLGWMVYKMSPGWYVLFFLISLLSIAGIIYLFYSKIAKKEFRMVNFRILALLILLICLSQFAMILVFFPSIDTSVSDAMGRVRFWEIVPASILVPLGLWVITPSKKREFIMKLFICFLLFLNGVCLYKYVIPIFYLSS